MYRNAMSLTPSCSFTFILLASIFFFIFLLTPTVALRFYLEDRERRCFKFDAPHGSRIIGQRSLTNGRGHAHLTLEVRSASGAMVYESHSPDPNQTTFAFTAPPFHAEHAIPLNPEEYEYDPQESDASFSVCLLLSFDVAYYTKSTKRAVSFWIRPDSPHHRPRALAPRASEEGVASVSRALSSMHDTLTAIISDLAVLQQREKRLVLRNETTARRLSFLSCTSLIVIVATSGMQYIHFMYFFNAKKLF